MIQEDYVSVEIAKLLKEKGFNCDEISCIKVFKGHTYKIQDNVIDADEDVTIPTLQMAMKWLRKECNIFISIVFCTYPTEKRVTWTPEISTFDSVFPESAIEYDSYEEACEAAIKYCLENLI